MANWSLVISTFIAEINTSNAKSTILITIVVLDMARMDKSPLLANGYNAPPTHLGPMGFMHQHALMSPSMHHGVPRPDGSIIKGQPMHNMEALARSGIWENCRAAYEDIVKHLERFENKRIHASWVELQSDSQPCTDVSLSDRRHGVSLGDVKNLIGNICVIESSTINFNEDQTKTEGDIYQGYCELF
ncbi:unnamed protein product [Danaus chrysippus]|uniref:(African queen) hypothetical protein n=1 Tax=Danaus chrysippus TaxID=151541 RepID=A0A8J2WAX7_9NEOP|nr:unnamed protein product [Danaus chrysippus]